MPHPEIMILPVIMILNFYLTKVSQKLQGLEYAKHYIVMVDENNKLGKPKTSFLRQLILIIIVSGILFGLQYLVPEDAIYFFIIGMVFGFYSILLGKIVNNILNFKYFNKNNGAIEGSIKISNEYLISVSINQNFIIMIPLLIISFLAKSPLIWGLFTSSVLHLISLLIYWFKMKLSNKKMDKQQVAT